MQSSVFDESHRQPMIIPKFNPAPKDASEELGYLNDTFMSMDGNSAHIPRIIRAMITRRLHQTYQEELVIAHDKGKNHMEALTELLHDYALEHNRTTYGTLDVYTTVVVEGAQVVGYVSLWNGTTAPGTMRVTVDGVNEISVQLAKYLMSRSVRDERKITRLYATRHGIAESSVNFAPPKLNIPSEVLFPQLAKSPERMVEDFLASRDNVLILLGEPGTGKSTYAKLMLMHKVYPEKRDVTVVDSIAAVEDEGLISRIYTMVPGSIVILEDIDVILKPRSDGNSIMSSLLNAAEGIASPDVKFIINTNLRNLDNIDAAIRRPGRCYDHVSFAPLTPGQQRVLLDHMGYQDDEVSTGNRTLADTMARRTLSHVPSGMGFVR